eukprot:6219283-Amphidinium_carterae.2
MGQLQRSRAHRLLLLVLDRLPYPLIVLFDCTKDFDFVMLKSSTEHSRNKSFSVLILRDITWNLRVVARSVKYQMTWF